MSWRENVSFGKVRVRQFGFKTPNIEGTSETKTLYTYSPRIQVLDPNSLSRDVILPPEEESVGEVFFISNSTDTVQSLVIKEDAGIVTIANVAQQEQAILFCDGVEWHSFVKTDT